MHLTSADKRAARDGFQFLVVAGGKRKCYCTTHAEAKSEAGRKGKIVSLGSLRYAARNPSIPAPYAKGWPSSRYGVQVRNPAKGELSLVGRDGKPLHLACFEYAGPFARTEALKPGETLETIKDDADSITHMPTGLALYSGVIAGRTVGGPARKKMAVAAMKALRGWIKTLSPEQVHTITHGFTRGSAKLTPAQDKLLREAYNLCRSAGYAIDLTRNPTWTTTAVLAGAAYVYGRSAKVREKIKGAIDRAHSKLENPGLTPAGKRHLIQTMHKAGADTFRKKVAYVRRHMPNVTDPQAFVGYIMKGEKGL